MSWAQSNAATGMKDTYTALPPSKSSAEVPEELQGVGITEKMGQKIDLNLMVRDESGQLVALGTFFKSPKPVILSLVYFNCPGLCNFHLNGLTDTLKMVDWTPGNEFEIVALSFDSRETADVAVKKKASYLKVYNRPESEKGWHFTTAEEAVVKAITDQVGFQFRWNEKVSEWSHASAAIIISPDGTISRYLHGIQFEPRDVKLALNEASHGKVGNIVDSVMLFCFKYDVHQSKYGLQVFRVMQVGAALTALFLALWLLPVLIRAKRENS
ncbi:MAG: photosynthetic protein synthase I [Bdellovibrionales bacterium RIFCSPHIGHO2_01_FULL_40_29]|nr:MAG: photosynthetic protein synthase I [Bdellovibrionales bacterium RIFCSPHIGHO2_01_FULL_40_29]OFZ35339.1 MAG: photosynthetic protein synthase I [Bdellovibrionales bacterium RIFCSPHIGHO2_02_FULL_40_15]